VIKLKIKENKNLQCTTAGLKSLPALDYIIIYEN